MIEELADLTSGFAYPLTDQRGIGTQAEFEADPYGVAATLDLPLDVSLILFRAGMMVFDFTRNPAFNGGASGPLGQSDKQAANYYRAFARREELVTARNKYINSYLCTLYAGGQAVTYGIPVHAPINNANYLKAQTTEGRTAYEGGRPPSRDWAPVAIFENASRILTSILDAFGDKDTFEILPLLNQACSHYSLHQFSSCLLLAWSVAEVLQDQLWKSTLKRVSTSGGGHTAISGKRLDQLNGRDYSASVISQTLSLLNRIDDSRLAQLDKARGHRNKFAHELQPVTSEMASATLGLAALMIGERAGLAFTIPIGFSARI